jgi:L-seryl-tRNA(Ser) seleniumtransferase
MPANKPTGPYPSVDRVSNLPELQPLLDSHGHTAVIDAIRGVIDGHRSRRKETGYVHPTESQIANDVRARLDERSTAALKGVFNLTGTVLHTNLGRALLSDEAIEHASQAMRQPCNLEYDLADGGRGDRDQPVEGILTELSGAEAATVVNNNAAAVLLVLAALAQRREVVLSRGELIEIGGSFRIPDVIKSAGARLIEVGTTNRTHKRDFENAIGAKTAALMKVHTSNYKITGFVAGVSETEMATIAHAHGLPLIIDLGAGSLIDLAAYKLPKEPVVREIVAAGADIVTFSGDKLVGGPQAGLIVGKKVLIDRVRKHPLKRALRVSKMTLAALEATLLAYRKPDRIARDLPTLRLLTRTQSELEAVARRLQPRLASVLGKHWEVTVAPMSSQVGSGSLPEDVIPSFGLEIRPAGQKSGTALNLLAEQLRRLPIPVIGRIASNRMLFDLRCLEDEVKFVAQLAQLKAG